MEIIDHSFTEDVSGNIPDEIMADFKYYFKDSYLIEPNENGGYDGDIYLLVDRYNYSSADIFVQFAKETGFAYIIGEPTSGEGTQMDSILLSLPNSGYVIQFPNVMLLNSKGENPVETLVEPNLIVGSREALDTAIELINSK